MFKLFNYNYYSEHQKTMLKSAFKPLEDTETSVDSQEDTKPCLKSQNFSEKSSIVRESPLKLLKTTFMSDHREHAQQKDEDCESNVSLEDDILHEHKQTLEQLFSKSSLYFNKKKVIRNSKQTKKCLQNDIFKQITLEHYLYFQLSKLRTLRPGLINLFESYLRKEKIFHRFLQHLYYSYPKHIVHEVFKYMFYTWQLYYPYLYMKLSISEAMSVANRIYEKMSRCEENLLLHSYYLDEQLKFQRRQLIEVMVVTVVLVMEKCFPNPHHILYNKIRKQCGEKPEQIHEQGLVSHKIIKRE